MSESSSDTNQTCGTQKTVIVALPVILLLAASFCVNHVETEKKGAILAEKSESLCEKEYKKFCLNAGHCYHLIDEDFIGWIYTCF